MPTDLTNALIAVADQLVTLASEDADLRANLRQLAQAILEATETARQEEPTPGSVEVQASIAAVADDTLSLAGESNQIVASGAVTPLRTDLSEATGEVLPELTLGRIALPVESAALLAPPRKRVTAQTDLAVIESRCRIKAEATRWAATRLQRISEGANFETEIEPRDRELFAKANLVPDCFLWMSHPSGPSPTNPALYADIAGCFEAVADTLAVIRRTQNDPDLHKAEFEHLLNLLAEAQSALRVAIGTIGGPADADQSQVFAWLKATASERQVYIQRHMRVTDPADPSLWSDLSARIEAVDAQVEETRKLANKRRKLLGKVRHKASLIADDPKSVDEHGPILVSTVDELVREGLPPSNRELRELLLPVIDKLPEMMDAPQNFRKVLREIDRLRESSPSPRATSAIQPSPEVEEARRLLQGRSVVLIGGSRRPEHYEAIKDAFGLQELYWIETREHQSIDVFEPYIARPDVAVVILAIRWSSHSYGGVQAHCDRYGKPFVRLPGGYNPNQVAVQILSQCSERLGRE